MSAVGRYDVPSSALVLADDAPPPPAPPAEGPFDAERSRRVAVRVRVGGRTADLAGWCRVGVWTTLREIAAETFVTREAWGRLGERKPRMLYQVADQVTIGVVVRLRPEMDDALSFVLEVADARIDPPEPVGDFHGEEVLLPAPRRFGYLFAGRAPPGWRGPIARWGDGVAADLGEGGAAPPGAVRFSTGSVAGFVAGGGAGARAETFLEQWSPARPVRTEADGVERIDYRLMTTRSAAGIRPRPAARGGYESYGTTFQVRTDAAR